MEKTTSKLLMDKLKEILKHKRQVKVSLPNKISTYPVESPEGLSDITYTDLLNIYYKINKIKSLESRFGRVRSKSKPEETVEVEGETVKEKVLPTEEITQPAVHEEPTETPKEEEIEFEKEEEEESIIPLSVQIEKLKEKHTSAREKLEKIKQKSMFKYTEEQKEEQNIPAGEIMEEKKHDVGIVIPYISRHEEVKLPTPSIIDISPGERANIEVANIIASAKKYTEVNKTEIASEVLRLTKELLKEKDPVKKAEIKEKIKQLKVISGQTRQKKVDILALLTEHQNNEFRKHLNEFEETIQTYKDSIENAYSQAKAIATGDTETSYKIEELHKEDEAKLKLEAIKLAKEYSDYLTKLHIIELEKIKGMGDVDNSKVDERINEIREKYKSTFNRAVKELLGVDMESEEVVKATLEKIKEEEKKPAVITTPVHPEPKVSGEKPGEVEREQILQPSHVKEVEEAPEMENIEEKILEEIKAMKTAQLLHYLSTRDKQAFRQYINGEIDRITAETIARRHIAKERGISEDVINKHFPLS